MKANRKFLNGNHDEAVSPVIAVILMVAITVVLAATVYVWVSGFGGSSGTPAKTISLSSNGALASTGEKSFVVASATTGMKWSDIKVTVNGAEKDLEDLGTLCAGATPNPTTTGEYLACDGTSDEESTDTVSAGDIIYLDGLSSGDTLRVLDSQANSVIYTLNIG